MAETFKHIIAGAIDASDIPDNFPTVERAVDAFLDDAGFKPADLEIVSVTNTRSGDDIAVILTTSDEDQSRNIAAILDDNGIPYVSRVVQDEDEHDRPVDRRYQDEARELEKVHLFMDMAHALTHAQAALVARINYHQANLNEWAGTIHAYGALTAEGRKVYDNTKLEINRLKQSHDRLGEMLGQHGIDSADNEPLGIDDMYATRQVDIWIRG